MDSVGVRLHGKTEIDQRTQPGPHHLFAWRITVIRLKPSICLKPTPVVTDFLEGIVVTKLHFVCCIRELVEEAGRQQ